MVCKSFKMLCNENFTYGFIEDQELGTENLNLLAQEVAGMTAGEPKPWQKISTMGAMEQSKGKAQHVSVPCTLKVMICKECTRRGKKVLLSGYQRCVHTTSIISKSRFFSHAVTFVFVQVLLRP